MKAVEVPASTRIPAAVGRLETCRTVPVRGVARRASTRSHSSSEMTGQTLVVTSRCLLLSLTTALSRARTSLRGRVSASLRRYDPDQVCRSEDRLPSQPPTVRAPVHRITSHPDGEIYQLDHRDMPGCVDAAIREQCEELSPPTQSLAERAFLMSW